MTSTTSPFKIKPHQATALGKTIIIWGDTDKLEEFLDGLLPVVSSNAALQTVQVDSHTVRRYPGDTGYTRKSHPRTYNPNVGWVGGITPGRNFWIEEEISTAGLTDTEWKSYQFTHTGAFYVLKAFVDANAKQILRLRSSGGRAHSIVPN